MLSDYVNAALRHATCEWLAEDRTYFCQISPLPGVWANADTETCALVELREVLGGWIALGLDRGDPMPLIDGIDAQPPKHGCQEVDQT